MGFRPILLLVLLIAVSGCAAQPRTSGLEPGLTPTATALTLVYEREFPAGTVQVLDDPQTVTAAQAVNFIGGNDMVMGIVSGGEARAYPLGMMLRYQLVNDTLNDEAIALTYCAACNTGLAFSRQVADQILAFDHSGLLLDNALVLVDRATGSQWSQARLQAVEGPLTGTRLQLLATNQVPWSEWAALYPQTHLVLDPRAPQRPATAAFVVPTLPDPGTPTYDSMRGYVVGVTLDDESVAYAVELIKTAGLVQSNEAVSKPLVLVALDAEGTVAVWERTLEGRVLTFESEAEHLRDQETQTLWDKRTGLAIEGPLQSKQLTPAAIWITDWRGWFDLYPETLLFQ